MTTPAVCQRRAVAGGRQRPGVAVGQHARTVGQQFSAECAHGAVDANIFGRHFVRLGQQSLYNRANGLFLDGIPDCAHALQGPEQIDRRRSASRQHVKCLVHSCRKVCG